jgi:ABC-type bacteriocin/lantibiotic exporter with double-glycine peptidase domain
VISHRPSAIEWADKIIALRNGVLVYDGPVSGFLDHAQAADARTDALLAQ